MRTGILDTSNPGQPLPSLRTDAQAEHFVDSADLSEYDLSGFRPMSFEISQQGRPQDLPQKGTDTAPR